MSVPPAIMQDFASRAAKAGIRLGPAPLPPPRFPCHGLINPEEMKWAAMKLAAWKRSEKEKQQEKEETPQKQGEEQEQQQQQHKHQRESSSDSGILIKLD